MAYLKKNRCGSVAHTREARTISASDFLTVRRRIVCSAVCAAALATALALPPSAQAGWPLDSAAPTALGFGATYLASDDMPSMHRGIDLGADAGSRVGAPLSGRVSFAGRVPGVGGGTVLAVTIVTAKGSLTLLPLVSTEVKAGTELAEGDTVGVLAGTGDASLSASHLHVGARKGDLYVDPLSLIALPSAPTADTPEPVPAGQVQPSSASDKATVPQGVTAVRAGASAPSGTAAQQPAGAPSVTAAANAVSLGAGYPAVTAVPGASLAPGVSVAGAVDPAAAAGDPLGMAAQAFSAAVGGTSHNRSGEGVPGGALVEWVLGLAARALQTGGRVLAGALLALGALWPVWRRERRKGPVQVSVRPVSDDVAAVTGR